MTDIKTELHFINGRICVAAETTANGKVLARSWQDVTAAVANAIAPYISNDPV